MRNVLRGHLFTKRCHREPALDLYLCPACPLPCCAALLSAGCRQDMHDAPRYDPLEASAVLPKGSSAQPLVRRHGRARAAGRRRAAAHRQGRRRGWPTAFPFAITRADLDRGEERFNIYCAPCHGRTGEGNGMVVQRGYRQAAVVPHRSAAPGAGRLLLRRDDQRLRRDAGLPRAGHGRMTGGASSPTSARCS